MPTVTTHIIMLTLDQWALLCAMRHAVDTERLSAALSGVGVVIRRLSEDDVRLIATATDGKMLVQRQIPLVECCWTTRPDCGPFAGETLRLSDPGHPDARMLDTRELVLPVTFLGAAEKSLKALRKAKVERAALSIMCLGAGNAEVTMMATVDPEVSIHKCVFGVFPEVGYIWRNDDKDRAPALYQGAVHFDPWRLRQIMRAMGLRVDPTSKESVNAITLIPHGSGRGMAVCSAAWADRPWSDEAPVRALLMPHTLPSLRP